MMIVDMINVFNFQERFKNHCTFVTNWLDQESVAKILSVVLVYTDVKRSMTSADFT